MEDWYGQWRRVLAAVVLLAFSCAWGCEKGSRSGGAANGGSGDGSKLVVVCTTGMVADLARSIGGDRVAVTQLMGPGVDPHLYRPSMSDIRAIREADVVLSNGLHLEGRMGEVLERTGLKGAALAVGAAIDPSLLSRPPEFEGQFDPHIWFDVSLWMKAGEAVRDTLVKRDPEGRGSYEANAGAYLGELKALHEWCGRELAAVPPERRVLVTAHDAFGYFGRAYGVEVRAIQGISTDSEASVKDINGLVDLIVSRRIPAVFVESSVPPKTIEALIEGCRARGHEVTKGGELFSDAMGDAGTAEGTYVGMVRHNVTTIVHALGKGAS